MNQRTPPAHVAADQVRQVPRFALRPEEAATSVGISLSTLNTLVDEKLLAKPFPVPGHPKILLFDPEDVRNAVADWKAQANQNPDGGWDNVR